ncbi:endo-1,4-beta-xylanase [Nocardiopsis sp. Huas11]|uniref:endo-1,4-beta-xylanase n=1 Tax=Nocardiopsis sp. Huas11 TaxID=2183912 RepID=UPI000EB0236C|nr:endo-1,4-beta-xylanase [Nocardiopsis sp. Huas11]RKS06587.1 endo-1,4-beta-xylanase [Nocardiopsis sp. Huas11]
MRPIRTLPALLTATVLALPLVTAAAVPPPESGVRAAETSAARQHTLRDAAPEGLVIGTAVAGGGHHAEQDYPDPFTHDRRYLRHMSAQFSSLSPENQMKWEYLRPDQDTYDFTAADAIVEFAEDNGQVVRGHTLLWHSQNPEWLEEGDFSREELRTLLREHITTVVGRYSGRIHQWDVTNEIFLDDGELRTQDNIWIRELGPEIIADAFRWAHEADPSAELFLNDYNVDGVNAKSDAYYELAQDLLDQGVPLHGFSTQGHLSLDYAFPGDLEDNLRRFDELGLQTAITELDVRLTPDKRDRPSRDQLLQQADYYRQALEACLNVEGCRSFTIWGFTDKYSWVPHFFEGEGHATVMTDRFHRKPAFRELLDTLAAAR